MWHMVLRLFTPVCWHGWLIIWLRGSGKLLMELCLLRFWLLLVSLKAPFWALCYFQSTSVILQKLDYLYILSMYYRVYADDALFYRPIPHLDECMAIHSDINLLETWRWQPLPTESSEMYINIMVLSRKCYCLLLFILFYLGGSILEGFDQEQTL